MQYYNNYVIYLSDIDECNSTGWPCSDDALCTNTEGSFICDCYSNFTGDGMECSGIYSNIMIMTRNKKER